MAQISHKVWPLLQAQSKRITTSYFVVTVIAYEVTDILHSHLLWLWVQFVSADNCTHTVLTRGVTESLKEHTTRIPDSPKAKF